MKRILLKMIIVVAGACAMSACDQPKSGTQVAKDTNAAEQKAAEKVAKAEQTAADKETDAAKDVRKDREALTHEEAVQTQNVRETEADGSHKIALARCEALSGSAQKSCRDQADAAYEVAKAKAKLARAQADPKP
jgi:hypothetical protein